MLPNRLNASALSVGFRISENEWNGSSTKSKHSPTSSVLTCLFVNVSRDSLCPHFLVGLHRVQQQLWQRLGVPFEEEQAQIAHA